MTEAIVEWECFRNSHNTSATLQEVVDSIRPSGEFQSPPACTLPYWVKLMNAHKVFDFAANSQAWKHFQITYFIEFPFLFEQFA